MWASEFALMAQSIYHNCTQKMIFWWNSCRYCRAHSVTEKTERNWKAICRRNTAAFTEKDSSGESFETFLLTVDIKIVKQRNDSTIPSTSFCTQMHFGFVMWFRLDVCFILSIDVTWMLSKFSFLLLLLVLTNPFVFVCFLRLTTHSPEIKMNAHKDEIGIGNVIYRNSLKKQMPR